MDSISGVSSATSTSFNEQQNEESAENIGQSLRSKSNKDNLSKKEIEHPTIIRYLKRMEIKYVFNTNSFIKVCFQFNLNVADLI